MTPFNRSAGLVVGFAILVSAPAVAGAAETLASHGDAFVRYDAAAEQWTLGTSDLSASFGFVGQRQFTLLRVGDPRRAEPWEFSPGPDVTLTIDDDATALAEGSTGLRFGGVRAEASEGGVRLSATYASSRVRIVRTYASYPGTSAIEAWTRVEAVGADPVVVSNFVAWQVRVPAGSVRWLNGLKGDAPDTPADEAFTLQQKTLAPGERLSIGTMRRSSELYVPFVAVDGSAVSWFGGAQWSGAWRIDAVRDDDWVTVTLCYPGMTTTVTADRALDIPHAFVGAAAGGASAVTPALHRYIVRGLRQGRGFTPLVTYNTWYAYGTRYDAGVILNEINQTAAQGVELFVLDAGWYPGAGLNGPWDFDTGLGTWTADPDRFPNGLAPIVDYAHDQGVKFGLWVEPARVDLATVGQPGLAREEYLATSDGANVSATTGKICMGSRAARQWVFERLVALIDQVRPDYLKWDNNMWLNCNRSDHDHGPGDGNLAQVQGLYAVLQALRERYPHLLIENVSDGGSRIDFGWLRYSDRAWMDDRTAPASHVRHNAQGLSTVFPPAYLLSFTIDDPTDPLVGAPDLTGSLRSRMLGTLGFSERTPGMRESIRTALLQASREARSFADIVANATAILLTDQVEADGDAAWDAVEELNESTGEAVILAFSQADVQGTWTVRPRGLRGDTAYEVSSLDTGPIAVASGTTLMTDGIELVQEDGATRGHVLVLRAANAESRTPASRPVGR